VDGLPDDRIALVTKIHHCMADGVAGASLMTALMRTDRDAGIDRAEPWLPRPAPTAFGMLGDEVRRRAALPLDALRALAVGLADPRGTWREARELLDGMRESVVAQLDRTLATPFNRPIGPHRRLDWASSDLASIKAIGKRLGGTVNDVVLAVFAGAMGEFLLAHGIELGKLPFKALVPVSLRDGKTPGTAAGNRLAFVIAELPVAELDPAARLEQVVAVTRRLKSSRMTRGTDALVRLLDATFPALFSPIARLGSAGSAYNLVVTNVPGPQFPTFFLGAKQLETYPFSPLFTNRALTVTAFSYDGRLFWGFNSDWDALPELHDLVLGVERELERYRVAAGIASAPSSELTREPAA
jgi:WS/DGAT/MGAT family acyltransferase